MLPTIAIGHRVGDRHTLKATQAPSLMTFALEDSVKANGHAETWLGKDGQPVVG